MIIKIKRKTLEQGIIGAALLSVLISILIGVSFTTNYVIGATNVTNNTVLARVNITNTEPNITSITVDDGVAPANQIDLIANGITFVTCNATVFDFNGWQDVNATAINATFHIRSISVTSTADNNYLYRNTSCGSCRQASESASPSTTAYCDCKFALQYYANDSSTWLCNMTVQDLGGTALPANRLTLTDTEVSSTTTVTKLLAINTSTLINYGNLSVTETSAEIVYNVTNAGNINLNLSLRGFGGTNDSVDSPGNNLTMTCGYGNITIGNQRYALGTDNSGTTAFANMKTLQNQTERTNLTLPARVDDSTFGWDRNSTLWRLQIPLSVGGLCNGTIIFGAIDAEG